MKKLLVLSAIIFLMPVISFAYDVWISSNTATTDTTKFLCGNNTKPFKRRAVFHSLCVNTGVAGTFTVYNSSAAAVNPVAAIDTTAKGCQDYDVMLSSGISYTNSATANVTLLYSCN